MADGFSAVDRATRLNEARARAEATPLDEFQVADVAHFTGDTHWPWFERLRREDPILKRFPFIEIVDEPRRLRSNFVKGYESMPVRIRA